MQTDAKGKAGGVTNVAVCGAKLALVDVCADAIDVFVPRGACRSGGTQQGREHQCPHHHGRWEGSARGEVSSVAAGPAVRDKATLRGRQ